MTDNDWDDERLEAAFTSAFDRPAPRDLLDRTLDAIDEPVRSQPHRWSSFAPRWRIAVIVVSLIVAVSAVIAVAASPLGNGGPRSAFSTYDSGTFHFTYPSSWDIHTRLPPTLGHGQTIAILGTLPVDPTCGDLDANCYYQERLKPGTLSITVGTLGGLTGTIFDRQLASGDSMTTVSGLPAILSDRGHVPDNYYESDLWMTWTIATPRSLSDLIVVDVSIRGPGTEAMRAQVEALIASLGFDGPPNLAIPTGSADAGLPGSIAARALEDRDVDIRAAYQIPTNEYTVYGCIPSEAWSAVPAQQGTVDASGSDFVSYGPGGWLGGPQEIECSATIEIVSGSYWRLVLDVTAGAGSSEEGTTYTETDWLAADGTLFQSTAAGTFVASLIDQGPDSAALATRAAIIAFGQLTGTSDFYACFGPTDGATQTGTITADPIGDTHYGSTSVTCTTRIDPRKDRRAWQVTLDARWVAADGHPSGHAVAMFDMDSSGNPGPVTVGGDSLPAVPPPAGATLPPQPAPSTGLSPSVDALVATNLAGRYETARSGGNWPEAWGLLSERSQTTIGSLAQFTAAQTTYNAAGGTEYVVQPATQDPDLIATFLGASRAEVDNEADVSRGYLIFISHPKVNGASEGSVGLFVAPLRSGEWRIWLVH